jgi:phosphatidylglycerophosphate synthase
MFATENPVRRDDPETQLAVHDALPSDLDAFIASLPSVTIDEEFHTQLVTAGKLNGERRARRKAANDWMAVRGHALEILSRARSDQKKRVRVQEGLQRKALRQFTRVSLVAWFLNWNPWAAFKFVFAVLAMLATMTASVVGGYELLRLASQFADNAAVCLVIATLVLIGSGGIKFIIEQYNSETHVRRIAWVLGSITTVLIISYCGFLAFATGGFVQPLPDLSSAGDIPGPTPIQLGPWLQWTQFLLEIFGSVTWYAYAQCLYLQYKSQCTAPNPDSWLMQDRLKRVAEALDTEQSLLRKILAARRRLVAEQRAFVDASVGSYLARAEIARRQRAGIDSKAGAKPAAAPSTPLVDRVLEWFRN